MIDRSRFHVMGALPSMALALSLAGCGDDSGGAGQDPAGPAGPDSVVGGDDPSGAGASAPMSSADGGTTTPLGAADAGPATATATDTSLAQACVEYVVAQCTRRQECQGGPPNLSQCLAQARQCPDVLFSEGSQRTLEGTIACANDWAEFPCDRFLRDEAPDCALPGTVPVGGGCLFGIQCDSAHCNRGGPDTCGVCVEAVPSGEACSAPDVVCEFGSTCVSGLCEANEGPPPALALGDDCSQGGSCEREAQCLMADEGVDRCTLRAATGEPCPPPSLSCRGGADCVYYAGAAEPYLCSEGAAAGEPCEVDAFIQEAVHCVEGARCDVDDAAGPTCKALPVAGEPCTSFCAPGHVCDCTGDACPEGTCIAMGRVGDPCDGTLYQCHPWASCEAGTCVALESQGLFAVTCAM